MGIQLTHIDVETSRLCKDNGILLYCLPAHTSHITQPLDVGLFKPLKVNWVHAVDAFRVAHVGQVMTKQVFNHMFKQAWIDTIKVHTIVNVFAASGVHPADMLKATYICQECSFKAIH